MPSLNRRQMLVPRPLIAAIALAAVLPIPPVHAAEESVLNLYSARHYQTDEALYTNFSKQTGIKINRIEASDDQLLERLRSEGGEQPRRCSTDRRRSATGAG